MKASLLSFVLFACSLSEIVFGLSPSGTSKKANSPLPSDCKDKISSTICGKYTKYCDISDSLKKLCKRTCGFCRAISPPPCTIFPYGCCWDGITIANGPNNKGCPVCKDNHKKCHLIASSKNCKDTKFKRTCPVSCGLCTACSDDPAQIDYCPIFRQSGFCESMKGSMKKICRKTCNLCDEK